MLVRDLKFDEEIDGFAVLVGVRQTTVPFVPSAPFSGKPYGNKYIEGDRRKT
jgi:hypothetical protein